jgi:uncharacterized membrane protein
MWIMLEIISNILAACNVIIAKMMYTEHLPNWRPYIFSAALVSVPAAGCGFIYLGTSEVFFMCIAFVAGMFYITAGYFYYRAMAIAQPLQLSLISRCSPAFTLTLSAILLHERLTLAQYIGFGITMGGGLVLVIEHYKGVVQFNQGSQDAIISAICGAMSGTFTVYLLQHYSLWQTFTMTRVGVVLGACALLGPRGLRYSVKIIWAMRQTYSGVLLGEQIIRLISLCLHVAAVAKVGSATLVEVLSGFSPLYVWSIAIAIGHETVRSPARRGQIIAFMMLLGGCYLMTR